MVSNKYKYKYEVHMHTVEGSACGRTPGAEYIPVFKELGYDGMIITDHFYHGNTKPSRALPWEDYIEEFCSGYEAAKAEGDKQGIKVFFGWEENHANDEYLIYGLDKAWLLKHPEIRDADQTEYLQIIHDAGGVVVQAHPFRERGYIAQVNVHPFQCDAMEVTNFGNPEYQDRMAYNFCRDRGILMTSGTDLHDKKNLAGSIAGMCFEKPIESIEDYVKAIKTGKGFKPMIPLNRRHLNKGTANTLPMMLYDENNVGHPVNMDDIFPYRK